MTSVDIDPSCQTITVIASSDVGLACLAWLLSEDYPVTNVFLGAENDFEIASLCERYGIGCEVYTEERALSGSNVDWLLSLWNPHLLPPGILSKARRRLNLHPALVPYCRGNDTAAWALLTGVPTGVSLLEMDSSVDAGAIWAQRRIEVTRVTKGADLLAQMKTELTALFRSEWPKIYSGSLLPTPQAETMPAYTRSQTNRDRVRDLTAFRNAEELFVWLRAHDFAPRSSAELIVDGVRYSVSINLVESPVQPVLESE